VSKKNKKAVPTKATQGPISAKQKWKEPTLDAIEAVEGRLPLSWRFSHSDRDGPYSWGGLDAHEMYALMAKLPKFEQMAWDALLGAGCHPIPIPDLCAEAKARLSDLKYDDIDELMSFRISGPKRLWCMREGSLMRVLWWDVSHQVYPTEVDRADRLKRKRRSR
jgi:hypothetical protein